MKTPILVAREGRTCALFLLIVWLFLFSVSVGSEINHNKNSSRKIPRKYDCSGGLKVNSEQGEKYVAEAINDALDILKSCGPCRDMFDSEDASYAIDLLERLKKNHGIIISARVPEDWSFSSRYQKLNVKSTGGFGDAAAMVIDLGRSSSGEMKLPCIYVNSTNFLVTGATAEDFALYGLDPPAQRAVAILHELAHVAGIIQADGDEKDEGHKSGANTDCIRHNCISCKEFRNCPGVAESVRKHRRKT